MILREELDKHPIFDILSQAATSLGYPTYVIGGWVRDLLLKRPSKDIDVVCQGSGIELANTAAALLPYKVKVSFFKNFGTANFRYGEYEVEFVGARKESYRRDSRKPIVEDGTLEDDQNRRDFTINALAISLNQEDYGTLVDPFDGEKDLKRRIIRTPLEPSTTFSDDPLRMMRAVRFASQLSFDIEPNTFDALTQMADRLSIISHERITDELNKIVLSNPPSYGFQLLFTSGMLAQFFPEMVALHGVEKVNGKAHKDNFYHTLKVLDNVAEVSDDLWLRWAAILHDIAKPPTKRFHPKAGWTFHGHEDKGARMVPGIFRRLKLPMGAPMKFVQKLVRLHLRPIALVKKDITDSAVRRLLFEAGDDVEALMKLCRADITSKNHDRVQRYLKNFDLVEKKMVTVEEKDRVRNFQPVITGEIIMQTFGIGPSKPIGLLKEAIKEAILDGEVRNVMEECFPLMVKLGQEYNLTPQKTMEDFQQATEEE
ncbi:MAG TPA: tRNA nucleotidyltransferase [Cytophagales bacterium]|nr:tRNA nucleotidyltransferase [Cytophagales bacterium]HAP64341.1 tRNA nucleotidyltransferase [Cytophagales bacterium]